MLVRRVRVGVGRELVPLCPWSRGTIGPAQGWFSSRDLLLSQAVCRRDVLRRAWGMAEGGRGIPRTPACAVCRTSLKEPSAEADCDLRRGRKYRTGLVTRILGRLRRVIDARARVSGA